MYGLYTPTHSVDKLPFPKRSRGGGGPARPLREPTKRRTRLRMLTSAPCRETIDLGIWRRTDVYGGSPTGVAFVRMEFGEQAEVQRSPSSAITRRIRNPHRGYPIQTSRTPRRSRQRHTENAASPTLARPTRLARRHAHSRRRLTGGCLTRNWP